MNGKIKILVVDDDRDDLFLTSSYLQEIDNYALEIETEINYKKAVERIQEDKHDLYIVDYLLGPHTGIELILTCVNAGVKKPFILLTGKGDRKIDIEATKAGAYDYLIKSEITAESLERSLRYSLQRYQAYKAVAESEKRFRDIFDKTTDIIFVLNSKAEFTNFNAAMTRILGYQLNDLLNKPITELFANSEYAVAFVNKMLNEGQSSNEELVLNTKDGSQKTFIASYIKIVTEDNHVEYQGILFDYTTIKKSVADELLREKTEATNQLVRTLAHEIRNPLTNIDLSVSQIELELREESRFFTDIIKRNSKRINDLIRELMDLSKPQINKFEKLDVRALLQETISRAHDRIELKRIKIFKSFPEKETYILADNSKMQIALLNIIINAIEAMETDGGVLQLAVNNEGSRVNISIADNGSGIDSESLSKLFQPYFTGKKNGMGLGLANTHSVIKSHKGEIDVKSTFGQGTTFLIQLPLAN
ncbi:MAG: ATP-binding protein [Chitinophagales bacterium]